MHMLLLAEIADKMMSWPALVAWSIGLAFSAWWLARKWRWLAALPLAVATLFLGAAIEEGFDPFFGPLVVKEFGVSYLVAAGVPFFTVLVFLLRGRRRRDMLLERSQLG